MDWYRVVKNIRGHQYCYWQRTERHGRRVKTFNIYCGPLARGWGPIPASLPTSQRASINITHASPSVTTTSPLTVDGEDDFIATMMTTPASGYTPAYRWARKLKAIGPRFADPDALRIGARMGVAMTSQIQPQPGRNNCPMYLPRLHRISVPEPTFYVDADGCSAERNLYVDTLHEIAHATKRDLKRPYSADAPVSERERCYNREEIVAELAANLVARRLDIAPENPHRSQAYLAAYARYLSEDDVDWAITEAQRAADYMLQFHPRGGWRQPVTTTRGGDDFAANDAHGKMQL